MTSFQREKFPEHAEVRRLFRWIAPNLGRELPPDVRRFLQGFAVYASNWSKPPLRTERLRVR